MAGVFLSYDRDDSAAAKVIANALEKSGHSVWWDLHVRGGAQFARVIEEALKAADAVVVLWSKYAIESAWVRDEASAGRDSGRLVPATIDGTPAPLGFRQFQTLDLTDWKRGKKSRGFNDLDQAVTELGKDDGPSKRLTAARSLEERRSIRLTWLSAVPAVAAIGAGAYLLWPSASSAVPTVAVLPASSSAMSQALSRDLLAKLGVLQASNSNALQLVEGTGGNAPDLIFKVDAPDENATSKASLLLLSGKDRALLWSGDFEQPSKNPSDLKQQLAYGAANVLGCASEAYGPEGQSLDDRTRRLYLKACGDFTRVTGSDSESLARTFREILKKTPRFEPAWARLLNAENEYLFNPPFDGNSPAVQAAVAKDIAEARKVNPDMPEAYTIQAELTAFTGTFTDTAWILDKAVQRNPDDPGVLTAHALSMTQVGRMRDAVSDARRALQIEPFSSLAQEALVSALTYSGQFDAAEDALDKGEALFPGASNLTDARYRLNLRYGSAQAALAQLRGGLEDRYIGQEAFLNARINPTPANVDLALLIARKRVGTTPVAAPNYIQTLAAFGRTEEVFEFLAKFRPKDQPGIVGVLFRPPFRDFWHNPRSMQIAARFGLPEYWQRSGHWPDFCTWPDLPYDCKKEAAKLKADRLRFTKRNES